MLEFVYFLFFLSWLAVVWELFSLRSGMSLLDVSIIDINHVYGLFSPSPVVYIYVGVSRRSRLTI